MQSDFEAAEKYARDMDVLLWSNSKQRKMVIAQE
jgi:transcription initiation factor TFIIH subunit 4